MRRRLKSAAALALAGGLLAAPGARGAEPAPPAPAPVPAAAPASDDISQELQLAEDSYANGLYEFVALRMERLLKLNGGSAFPGSDRAELLLAESRYLSGRPADMKAADEIFRAFPDKYGKSAYLPECRLWGARARLELRREAAAAAGELEKLLGDINGEVGRSLDGASRARLTEACRYWMALSLVEQGGDERLDRVADPRPAGKSGLLDEMLDDKAFVGELAAMCHVLRARALCLSGHPELCISRLQEHFLDKELSRRFPACRAEAFFWQGESRYGQGKWEEAVGLYSQAIDERGVRPEVRSRALYGRGWAARKRAEDLRHSGLSGDERMLTIALQSFQEILKIKEAGSLAGPAELRAGEMLGLLGRHRESRDGLRKILADPALGTEALLLSALAESGMGRHAEARKLFKDTLGKLGEANGGALLARAEFARGVNEFTDGARLPDGPEARNHKQWVDAAECFEKAARLYANDSERLYECQLWTARTLARQGRFEEALKVMARLQSLAPARESLRGDQLSYYIGECMLRMAKAGESSLSAETLEMLYPQDKEQGKERGTYNQAIKHFNVARQIGPRGVFAVPSLMGSAEASMQKGSFADALGFYTQAREDVVSSAEQREEARLGMARAMKSGGSFKKAAELLLTEVIEGDAPPSERARLEALRLRVDCLELAGDSEGASAACQALASDKALAGKPEAARVALRRTANLRRMNRHAEAAAELAALMGKCPADMRAEVLLAQADAESAAGLSADAIKHYGEYARANGPEKIRAFVAAAELALDSGRAVDAAASAENVLGMLPARAARTAAEHMLTARVEVLLARARVELNNPKSAAEQFERAAADAGLAALNPDLSGDARALEVDALLGLGGALTKSGRHDDAAAAYLRAASLPDQQKDMAIKAALARRTAPALGLAVDALIKANRPEAAEQVRKLISSKSESAQEPVKTVAQH